MANTTEQVQAGRPSDAAGGRGYYKMAHTFDLAFAATSDVIYCFLLPGGHRLLNVTTQVIEAAGETAVVSAGMSSDLIGTLISSGTEFDASINVAAAAGTLTSGTGGTDAAVTAGGYINLSGADTYLVLVPTVSASPLGALGKLRVVAQCVDES